MKILGVETQSSVRKKVSVMVPKDVVQDTLSHKVEEFQKSARVPGFRKGKVPESLIKSKFEHDIKYEAELDVIDHTIGSVLEQSKIKAVGSPVIEKVDYTGDGDLTYTVIIENIPEIERVDFKGIELKKLPVPPVTDEQVQEALVKIQKRLGVLMPLEEQRPLRENDLASVKLTELDRSGKPGKVNDDLLWAVNEKLGKHLYDQVMGMLTGEKRTITADPAKNAQFLLELKGIKYIKYPPIDDELAKTSGMYATLDELKSALKKDIEEEIDRINRLMYQDMIVAALLQRHPLELPVSLVKKELEHIATEDQDLKRAYGMNNKQEIEDRLKQIETYVRIGLTTRIFFDTVKSQENVVLSDEEVKAEIAHIAQHNNDTPEHITEKLTKDDSMDTVRQHLINEKILDLILKNAQFIEEKVEK